MSHISLDDVLNCPALPSLPAAAAEVLELARDRNVNLRKIADVVQKDPALTTKILKTVNSSFYGLAKPCPTILRALTYLGLNTVKALVLGFSLVDVTKKTRSGFDFEDFWRRSLYSAAAARRAAERHGECDPEEAFVGALLADIGMLALQMTVPYVYGDLIAQTEGDHGLLCEIERNELGLTHAQVGAAFAKLWQLPQSLMDAILQHHELAEPDGDAEQLAFVRTVALATEMVIAAGPVQPGSATTQVREHADAWFELAADEVDYLFERMSEDAKQLASLFKVEMGGELDINRLLGDAQDEAARAAIEQQREVEALQRVNTDLEQRVTRDALTEVGNRSFFDEEIALRYEQATSLRSSVGLLMVDVDHFKQLNDGHGHVAGDRVLQQLAKRVGTVVRGQDLVCRYGGEEFAVILPAADDRCASAVAERLRQVVADSEFEVGDNPDATVRVSVSVGVAVLDPASAHMLATPEILVQAADRAMYAAKSAGRNCVRVFRAASQRGVA